MAPELKFLLIKAQIAIKSPINSFKNQIKSINIQIWAFLLKFQIFLLNRALLLQEYTVKNPIFVFLTSLTNFPTTFWALLPPVIFLTSFGYIILYIFCGDPKMGYNTYDLFVPPFVALPCFMQQFLCFPFLYLFIWCKLGYYLCNLFLNKISTINQRKTRENKLFLCIKFR